MDEPGLIAVFEANRPRLRALAYRMLGSHEDAEDAVQEAWIRVDRAGTDEIENVGGWFTTVLTRLCLDRLRARRARPEDAVDLEASGAAADGSDGVGPEDEAVMADSVGSALLVVLDRLAPAERVAFVLHDVFALPFDEIGTILDRTPEAARQLASRARRRVQGATAGGSVDLVRQREIVDAFLAAAQGGDLDRLLAALDPDVVLRPDSAAELMGSLRETHGARAVAELLRGGARGARRAVVGGLPGLAWAPGGRVRGAIELAIVDDRIVAIHAIGDPVRIAELEIVLLDD